MSEFVLYEVTTFNDVEIKKEHSVKEVLFLDSVLADILVGYFDNIDDSLKNNVNESRHYITLWGEDLIKLINLLEDLLNSDSNHWYLFLKCVLLLGGHSYSILQLEVLDNLCKSLKSVVPLDSVSNRERLFLYSILR